jgi:hypothetical protein
MLTHRGFAKALLFAMTALVTTPAAAARIPLAVVGWNDTNSYVNKTSDRDVAVIMGGPDRGLVDGAFTGAASALTSVNASAVFYGSEVAGVSFEWLAGLGLTRPGPAEWYLDINTWVSTDEFIIALGSVHHGIYAEFQLWEFAGCAPDCYRMVKEQTVSLDSTGDFHQTILMGEVSDPVLFYAGFEVASGLSFAGPGTASAAALGYINFTLSAEGPDLPSPTPTPGSPTVVLLGFGLLGLALCSHRVRGSLRRDVERPRLAAGADR